MPEHLCPYANAAPVSDASLSEDEDASASTGESRQHHSHVTEEALSAVRKKCPAFANNSCPFREAGMDSDSLREVIKTVPPSHFPGSSSAPRGIAGDECGEGEGGQEAAATFQLAMEHVHNVHSRLERQMQQQKQGKRSASTKSDSNDRSSFIIRGGCPFKSFHQEHLRKENNAPDHLAHAMAISLAAIMGRMAEDFDEEPLLEEDGEKVRGEATPHEEEEEGEDSAAFKDRGLPSMSKSDEEQAEDDISPKQQRPPSEKNEEGRRRSFLSQALKIGTQESHAAAESVHFVDDFIKGRIERDLYADLVSALYHSYVTLEKLLDQHAPDHFPTLHFPKELGRREALEEDMEYWHGLDWRNNQNCSIPSPAVMDYIERMEEVGRVDPMLLLSHAYTRYLGDLSGGKVLARVARRALNLAGHDGLAFYEFEHVESAKLFKDKYRRALDELVLTPDQVGGLVAEANVAFALNMRVFEELDVKGGVEGARVRDVWEALRYYYVEIDEQKRRRSRGESLSFEGGSTEEEAKCPFGFVGGPNPHHTTAGGHDGIEKRGEASSPQSSDLEATTASEKRRASGVGGGGRCPWPFVFFHDPKTGMMDWQTWFVIGLFLCWCWSCVH